MSNQDSKMNWTDVVKQPKKQKPTIILSQEGLEKHKKTSEAEQKLNHDSRFDPIILTKPKTTVITNQVHTRFGGKNTHTQEDTDMRKIERGEIKLATSDKELAHKIQIARISKKLSQDQLNKECSFPPNTIRNYENCTAIAKQSEIDVLRKKLGLNDLHKPKAIKIKEDL
jgi:ribosome-binding protein aMBF1 (putative translation factor)